MKISAIINPQSANQATGRQWPELKRQLERELGPFAEHFTTRPGQAAELARQALAGGVELVLSVGGDGTHNEVVNGFLAGGQPLNPAAALAIVPRGTGGDLRKTLGLPAAIDGYLACLRTKALRTIDVGQLDYLDHAGRAAQCYFVNITSFGIGGLVDRYVNTTTKALGGKASFFIGTLRALAAYRNQTVRLRLDGGPEQEQKVINVVVANGQYFGGGMWIAPEAKPDDGLFDVVTIGDLGLADFLLWGGRIYKGTHLRHPQISLRRARVVEAFTAGEALLDMDGEQPGKIPGRLECLPHRLRVLVGPSYRGSPGQD